MWKPILIVLLFGFIRPAISQDHPWTDVRITSSGDAMQGQFFVGKAEAPRSTLLLIPGWPGSQGDLLGLGGRLSHDGVNVLVLNPRGLQASEGRMTFQGVLTDIGVGVDWLYQTETIERFGVDTTRLILGGHSFGGGMTMAYAARDRRVRRIVSVAGTDHAEFIRHVKRSPEFEAFIMEVLRSTRVPEGDARFDLEGSFQELYDNQGTFGLIENSENLADRSILLIGGWEDTNTSVEQYMLPLYRALQRAGAVDVSFKVYHATHGFRSVREELAEDIKHWLVEKHATAP